MSSSISTLLTRNLHDVFGENDPARRRGFRSILRDWGVWSAVQYRPRRSPDWLKMKNSTAPAIIYLSFT
jgi:hypothetical protein